MESIIGIGLLVVLGGFVVYNVFIKKNTVASKSSPAVTTTKPVAPVVEAKVEAKAKAPTKTELNKLTKKAIDEKAACVAISINSPGGSPVQSHLIYSFIRQQAKKHKKKVIVFAEDVAASGGYLISCAGDEIYANSSSIIGSIGVIYSSFGFTELIKKIGVERRVHTAGKNKSTLDPFLEEKNEDIERLKNIQLDLHKDFIDVVEKSRGSKLNKSDVELFSGEFWSGSKAKNLGLIDGIGNAHEILRDKFGEDVIIKKFEKSKGWLSQKLSSSSNQVDQIASILDERSIWQRYGF